MFNLHRVIDWKESVLIAVESRSDEGVFVLGWERRRQEQQRHISSSPRNHFDKHNIQQVCIHTLALTESVELFFSVRCLIISKSSESAAWWMASIPFWKKNKKIKNGKERKGVRLFVQTYFHTKLNKLEYKWEISYLVRNFQRWWF